MKKTSPFLLLLLIGLLITMPPTDAATLLTDSFNDNYNFEDIEVEADPKKWSKEVSQGFRLSKNGLHEKAFKTFTQAAKRNELTAYLALGVMHREGRGTPKNIKLAKENFKKAADIGSLPARKELFLLRFTTPGNPKEFAAARKQVEEFARNGMPMAQLRLGMAHLTGYGYTPDASKAIDFLTQAAKSTGSHQSQAAFILGQLYRDGNLKPEVKPDAKLAESWLKTAAEAKHPAAMRALGELYLSPDPAKQNFARARDWFSRLDQLGDPYGLYYLGQMSENGWGGEKSLESAASYYRKAADKKVPSAIYRLATFLENGLGGLKKDQTKATDYYRQGAELGHPFCMYNLSVMLDSMDKNSPLKAEVMPWLIRSAAAGLIEAEYQIGTRYQQGRGVPQDYVAAVAWFDRASRSGHAQAQLYLGEMYEKGQGVKPNHSAARRLFELAAKRGNLGGQLKYAEVLANGIGGKQDLPEAYFYAQSATKASESNTVGSKIATQLRDNIIKIMTPAQLAEGKKLITNHSAESVKPAK